MAYNRFRIKEKHKRRYTFSRSKVVAGFLLSGMFSVILGPYFEHYGPLAISQVAALVSISSSMDSSSGMESSARVESFPSKRLSETALKPQPRLQEIETDHSYQSSPYQSSLADIDRRLNRLERRAEGGGNYLAPDSQAISNELQHRASFQNEDQRYRVRIKKALANRAGTLFETL